MEISRGVLTHGAVHARPLGITHAVPRLGAEGPMVGALLGTGGLQDLADGPPPARVAVAFPVMTGSMTGTHRIHAVHWGGWG